MEDTTRKVMESLATNLVRARIMKETLNKPSEDEVIHGVKRVMKDIEREHGSINRAALDSPDVSLKPVVEASISRIKW